MWDHKKGKTFPHFMNTYATHAGIPPLRRLIEASLHFI